MQMREQAAVPNELPLRPQDEAECRRCEVHCDKVVYPGACVERNCPFLYSFEEFGHTYVGCMQRVYDAHIDFDLLRAAESGRAASARSGRPRLRCRSAAPRWSRATRAGWKSSAASTPSSTSCRSASLRSA